MIYLFKNLIIVYVFDIIEIMAYLYHQNPERPYLVYEHYRADTGEIFYVGKGKGNRAFKKHPRSKHWQRIVAKHGLKVRIVADFEKEIDTFCMEIHLISFHGRLKTKDGLLINLTRGGEGCAGHSNSSKGKKRGPRSKEYNDRMRGSGNPRYDHTVYHWINIDGREFHGTSYEFNKNFNTKNARGVATGINNYTEDGWSLYGQTALTRQERFTGENNLNYDATIYHWIHEDGTEEFRTVRNMEIIYGISLHCVKNGDRGGRLGWHIYGTKFMTKNEKNVGENNPRFDRTLYHWRHTDGTERVCTQTDLRIEFNNLIKSGTSSLVRGHCTYYKNWTIVK